MIKRTRDDKSPLACLQFAKVVATNQGANLRRRNVDIPVALGDRDKLNPSSLKFQPAVHGQAPVNSVPANMLSIRRPDMSTSVRGPEDNNATGEGSSPNSNTVYIPPREHDERDWVPRQVTPVVPLRFPMAVIEQLRRQSAQQLAQRLSDRLSSATNQPLPQLKLQGERSAASLQVTLLRNEREISQFSSGMANWQRQCHYAWPRITKKATIKKSLHFDFFFSRFP